MDNINSANFYKLLSLSAAVGIVCISLITIMFKFISRFNHISEETEDKDKCKDKIKHKLLASDVTFIIVILILLGMLVVGLVSYKQNPEEKLINSENSINANINVSGLYNEDETKATFTDENNNLTANLDEAASAKKID